MSASPPGAARVLVLNVGSGTLKWTLFRLPERAVADSGAESWQSDRGRQLRERLQQLPPFDVVGHRIVHGGTQYRSAALIDAPVRAQLALLCELDPLHMEPALQAVDVLAEHYPQRAQVAAFDTAFHATLPPAAACYALPFAWTERWGLRRFGFHGLSVDYAVGQLAALAPAARSAIVCHLGSGCSITAVRDRASVDTTMGFSPLEGLMMATRAGSVDPGLLLHLQLRHGLTPEALHDALAHQSGWLGMSGVSADLREVMSAARNGSRRAALACERFVLDVRRGIGAMAGVLGRVDALVFTGGIGENSAQIRADTAPALAGLGLQLDDEANRAGTPGSDLARPESTVRIFTIHSREDLVILDQLLRVWPARIGVAA